MAARVDVAWHRPMRVLVTRPEPDAQRWVEGLRARGFAAQALPLIAIAPAADAPEVARVWQQLESWRALMFVSRNAVEHFFAALPVKLIEEKPWRGAQLQTRAWAPGPGTCEALVLAGVDAALIDSPSADAEQFDSQHLWRVVEPQVAASDRVLIVRGCGSSGGLEAADHAKAESGAELVGRDWLARKLAAASAQVDFLTVYQRLPPAWSEAQLALAAQAAGAESVWLFSSAQALANLAHCLPGQDWRTARAVATHPRIAQAARTLGFAVVCLSRPSLDEVAASIESIA